MTWNFFTHSDKASVDTFLKSFGKTFATISLISSVFGVVVLLVFIVILIVSAGVTGGLATLIEGPMMIVMFLATSVIGFFIWQVGGVMAMYKEMENMLMEVENFSMLGWIIALSEIFVQSFTYFL